MIRWPWSKPEHRERKQAEARAAFERLAQEHARSLYGAALRMARNPEDARDLVQEALVRAYSAFDTFEPGTNYRAWILRIMTNLYITVYRRRRLVSFHSWDDRIDDDERGPASTHVAPTDEPEAALLAHVVEEEIETALAHLSEPVRLTLLLVDVEELSYEEAATALNVPVGTVRSRLNRAREQMRACLSGFARDRRLG